MLILMNSDGDFDELSDGEIIEEKKFLKLLV